MGRNKMALIRYRTIDKCLSNPFKHYFIDDLRNEVNAAIQNEGYSDGVSERQIYEDLRFMKSENGWNIELEEPARINKKRYYRYKDRKFTINDAPVGGRREEIVNEAILVLNELSGIPGFYWLNETLARLVDRAKSKQATHCFICSQLIFKGIILLFNGV